MFEDLKKEIQELDILLTKLNYSQELKAQIICEFIKAYY